MSKVLDVLKSIPSAIGKYDEQLPQSDATPGFHGKGLLTALIDTTGSELNRRRAIQDDIRNGTGKFLIQNFWNAIKQGTPDEVAEYQKQLLNTYGHDKSIKKWMTEELFPRAEQLQQGVQMFKGAPEGVQPQPPQMPEQPEQGAPDQALASIYSGMPAMAPPPKPAATPVPAAAGMLNPPPSVQAQTAAPAASDQPSMEAAPVSVTSTSKGLPPQPAFAPPPAPTSPLQSILRKVSPIPLTEQQKLEYAESAKQYDTAVAAQNTLEKEGVQHDFAMDLLQAQIKAGRYEKVPKNAQIKTVIDPATNKASYVAIYNDPDTSKVTYTLLNDYEATSLGSGNTGPTEQDIQAAMKLYGFDRIKAREFVEEIKSRGRAQGTADINGVPLSTNVVNGMPMLTPRPQAANTPAAATTFQMSGVPSVGGVQGISLTPPPTVPATTQEQIANLRTSINLLDSNVIPSIKKNADVLGPVMGRIKLGEVALGGYGLTQPQIQMVLDLQRLMTSEAFANGGKQLTSTELGQFEKLLPKPTDTLQTALTKAKSARDFLDARLQSRLGVMPARERLQIPGEGGGAVTGGAGTDMVKVINKDGKPGRIPRANLQKALAQGYKEVK